MSSLKTTIRASIGYESKKSLDQRDVVDTVTASSDILLGSGTGTGKADIAFCDTRTLAASTSENLDLAGGITDAFGATVNFVKVKAIEIENPAASLSNLTIGASGANAFVGPFADASDGIVLKPGEKMILVSPAGWPVTPAIADILKVANGAGGSVDYKIKIVGASA